MAWNEEAGGRKGGNWKVKKHDIDDTIHRNKDNRMFVNYSSPVIQEFLNHRQEMDSRHDKHERIVKISRDITIGSKHIIFLLHRCLSENKDNILSQAEEKLQHLEETLFKNLVVELQDEDPYQYLRAYYSGLQEYIEAVTFHDYIKGHSLSTDWIQLEKRLTYQVNTQATDVVDSINSVSKGGPSESGKSGDSGTCSLHIPASEYMLGVLDMSGEVMRLCVSAVAAGERELPFALCQFARDLHSRFDTGYRCSDYSSSSFTKNARHKLNVLRQSLEKMERTCYTIVVRGEEVPADRLCDDTSVPTSEDGTKWD